MQNFSNFPNFQATKELLSGAIALSGSATAGWAVHRQAGTTNQWEMANIAEYIRCNKLIEEGDLAEVLAQVPVAERDRWEFMGGTRRNQKV